MEVDHGAVVAEVRAFDRVIDRDDVRSWQIVGEGKLDWRTFLPDDDAGQVLLRLGAATERDGRVVAPECRRPERRMHLIGELAHAERVVRGAR